MGVAAAAPAIHTVDLTKRFGGTVALTGLSMTVPRGAIFGFLGPNGAGKATSVKLLLGLLKPSSGEAWLLGEPIGDLGTRRRIGYLPELFRYQGWLDAREVLALHCELAPLPRSTWKEEIAAALGTVGLTDRADDRVSTFSKGMQQRLGLAAALVGKPELVFLDEPTSALDPVGRHDVREIIRGLSSRGTAVFLNSHLLSEVEQVCDRVAVVDHGRVIASGTMDELLSGTAVKVRVSGLDDAARGKLAAYGPMDDEGAQLTLITSQLLIVVPFMYSGVLALSAAVVAGPLISSEVESGLLLSMLAHPVRRSEVVIGKWLELAVLVTISAAGSALLELTAVNWATGYLPPHPIQLVIYVAAEGLTLLSLGLLLSTRLSGITGGVIALVAWLMAWIAGVVGDIGTGLQNSALQNVGTISHLLLPTDGLWRGAVYAMEPDVILATLRAAGTAGRANPFSAVDPPPTAFLTWVVVWFALILGLSVWSFRRREI